MKVKTTSISFYRLTLVQIISHCRAKYLSLPCEIIRTAVRRQNPFYESSRP